MDSKAIEVGGWWRLTRRAIQPARQGIAAAHGPEAQSYGRRVARLRPLPDRP